MTKGAREQGPSLLALFWIALLATPLLATWPLALNLGTHFPGDDPTDAFIHARQLWWVPRALGALQNPYVSPILLYPQGARLTFETLVPLNGVLTWPLALAFGPLAAYNLGVLAMLVAGALATWALASHVSGSREAGAVGALAYVASPYLLNHVRYGHLGVISAPWMPLALLGLLRSLETRRPGWILLAAGCLAALAYTDLQGTLAVALLAPVLLLARLLARPREAPAALAALVVTAALALVLAAPLLAAIAGELRGGADITPPAEHTLRNSADLLAFASPQPLHPLWGAPLRAWYAAYGLDLEHESVVYPGLAVLALAGLGLASASTSRPLWALVALAMALLALGPRLHLGGPQGLLELPLGLPTPYAVLQTLPLVGIGRTPARFMGPAMLALALLAACGVVALRARLGRRAILAAPLAAALIAFEFLPVPFPLSPVQVPGAYRAVIERGCAGPLLELPVDAGSPDQKRRMFFQALHGCPISGGYVSRGGDATELHQDWRKAARQEDPGSRSAQRLGEEVRTLGFQYLVIWWPAYESPREAERDLALVQALFPGDPLYSDQESTLYRIAEQ